jgi:general secretion pathway protein L
LPGLLAIDLAADTATVVKAELTPNSRFRITTVSPLPIDHNLQHQASEDDLENATDDALAADENTDLIIDHPLLVEMTTADSTFAVVRGDNVLFHSVSLPFDDPKKVDQVLPFQLQDIVPFDIDSFVIDSTALKKQPSGNFEFLTSIIPEKEVASALGTLSQIGADPKVLTARCASLVGYKNVFPEQLKGSFMLLYTAVDFCAIAVYIDDNLKLLREIYLPIASHWPDIARQLRCSVGRLCRDAEVSIDNCFVLGRGLSLESIGQGLNMRTQRLDLREIAELDPGIEINLDEVAWALGVFADETQRNRKHRARFNFRRGPYAYRPLLQSLVNAFRDQVFYLLLFAVLLIAWAGSSFFTTYSLRTELDQRIAAEIQSVLPGESAPKGSEASFMEQQIEDLEADLLAFGSLSSLTPLNSLKELSNAIDRSINIEVDSIQIDRDRLELKGTVSDYKAVGRLNGLLEARADRFCEVTVDTKEQAFGSKRVKFSADIILCKE